MRESTSGETTGLVVTGAVDDTVGVEDELEAARRDCASRADEEVAEKVEERDRGVPGSSVDIAIGSTLPARLTPSLPARFVFFLLFLRRTAASPV